MLLTCRQTLDRMSDALDGRLDAAGAAEVSAHVASCDACRREWEGYQELRHALAAVGTEAAPPALLARVGAAIRTAPQDRPAPASAPAPEAERFSYWSHLRRLGVVRAAAMLIVAVLAISILVEERNANREAGRSVATSEDAEARKQPPETPSSVAPPKVSRGGARPPAEDIPGAAAQKQNREKAADEEDPGEVARSGFDGAGKKPERTRSNDERGGLAEAGEGRTESKQGGETGRVSPAPGAAVAPPVGEPAPSPSAHLGDFADAPAIRFTTVDPGLSVYHHRLEDHVVGSLAEMAWTVVAEADAGSVPTSTAQVAIAGTLPALDHEFGSTTLKRLAGDADDDHRRALERANEPARPAEAAAVESAKPQAEEEKSKAGGGREDADKRTDPKSGDTKGGGEKRDDKGGSNPGGRVGGTRGGSGAPGSPRGAPRPAPGAGGATPGGSTGGMTPEGSASKVRGDRAAAPTFGAPAAKVRQSREFFTATGRGATASIRRVLGNLRMAHKELGSPGETRKTSDPQSQGFAAAVPGYAVLEITASPEACDRLLAEIESVRGVTLRAAGPSTLAGKPELEGAATANEKRGSDRDAQNRAESTRSIVLVVLDRD